MWNRPSNMFQKENEFNAENLCGAEEICSLKLSVFLTKSDDGNCVAKNRY